MTDPSYEPAVKSDVVDPSSLIPRLHRSLAATANGGGGWPYYSGKSSRIEPTAWALVALAATWQDNPAEWPRFLAPHLQWLAGTQRRDGLLGDVSDAPPNLTSNGLAACVLSHLGKSDDRVLAQLVGGIADVKGVSVNLPDPRQDNKLQGWPWISGTFSWLEPTCWGVLALKKAGAGTSTARARIDEAEKLIINRSCEPGGWNFGNASAIGQDLRPYVPTTALGLMALQDRRTEPAVGRALAWLGESKLKERSGVALSLAVLCLRIYGMPAADVESGIAADVDRAERVGNLQAIAMMLYALSTDKHDVTALRV
jgi:hypothetical protein